MKVKDLIKLLSEHDGECEIGGLCRDGMFIPIEGCITLGYDSPWDDVIFRSDYKTNEEFKDEVKEYDYEKIALLDITIRP